MDDHQIEFMKYKLRGAYHWEQISRHPYKANAFVKARYEKCIELIKKQYPNGIDNKSGLDLGCGDGVLSFLLWKNGARMTGIDKSDIAIQYAREKHSKYKTDCEFIVSNACEQSGENSYDFIVCSDVIEHVPDPIGLLKEIRKLLRPNGVAVISTPVRFTQSPLDTMHVVEWFEKEFSELVDEVFGEHESYLSHPLFWMEFMNRSTLNRIFTNLLSIVKNPFKMDKSWRYYAMQYVVVKK